MYRGPAGIDAMNKLIQEIFNPNVDGKRREITFGDSIYRVGDKVLQLVNQPESNVYNGDMGEIISISFAKENTEKQDLIYISFDGIEVAYTKQDLTQITHAYCCSIHKSQGSEFPIVIMPIVKSYYRMLRRKLIYTGITRSKQFLILCGEEDALRMGVERTQDYERNTTLKQKLKEAFSLETADEIMTEQVQEGEGEAVSYLQKLLDTDPMIGMENVTPYDFMVEK